MKLDGRGSPIIETLRVIVMEYLDGRYSLVVQEYFPVNPTDGFRLLWWINYDLATPLGLFLENHHHKLSEIVSTLPLLPNGNVTAL